MANSMNRDYWTKIIHDVADRCDLNGLFKVSRRYKVSCSDDDSGVGGKRKELKLDANEAHNGVLHELCSTYGLSLPTVLQFVWQKALNVYGNGIQTVVATAILLKDAEGHDFVTPPRCVLPVIFNHHEHCTQTILEALHDLEKSISKMHESKTYACLDELKTSWFDSLLVFCDFEIVDFCLGHFPIEIHARELDKQHLTLSISYNAALFDDDAIGELLEVTNVLLAQTVSNVSMKIADMEFLSAMQKRQLGAWNCTDAEYPSSKRLHQLFEEAVRRTPDAVAVLCDNLELTYRQLNDRSNLLAHHLCTTVRVQPEQFIALFLDKSELTISTIIGIWKSGAAYVPIDPTFPDDRVRFILEDTQAKIVIGNLRHMMRLEKLTSSIDNFRVIALEPLMDLLSESHNVPQDSIRSDLTSSMLAYATYTSGTTGVPKAIYKQHNSVVNSITDLAEKYNVGEKSEAIVLFSAYVFEPFARQMLMALLNSQRLVIVGDDEKLDPDRFPEFLKRHGITYLNGTGSVLREFDYSDCPKLTRLVLVGEHLTEALYRSLRQTFKHRIINEYGFTESAFVTAMKSFELNDERTDRSIGRPLRNVKCYVLNSHLKQLPVGAIGELYIGGNGVSRGYLNRPELTKERFLQNPYQTEAERRQSCNSLMYKTGDLARWLPNGEVEYLGRNDFQLKLRGIRIEPGEIETIVCKYPGVERCVVVAKSFANDGDDPSLKHLVGYYVSVAKTDCSETDLLSYLETKIPRYMMPTRMIKMERIPVTVNGKVDLRALPELHSSPGQKVCGVRNDLDDKLLRIWSETLGVLSQDIGIGHDFFRLGGHSITCIQLIGRIRQSLDLTVTVEEIFSLRTLEKLSDHLRNKTANFTVNLSCHKPACKSSFEIPASEEGKEINGCYLANSLQQGFVYHYLKQSKYDDAYIMQSVHEYKTKINPIHFRRAWELAQQKYSCLRLRFVWQKEVLQIIDREQLLDWQFINQPDQSVNQLLESDRRKRYFLEKGNLFRIYLVRHNDESYSLIFSCHHIILDGWSLFILFDYVHKMYVQLMASECPVVEPDTAYQAAQKYLEEHRRDHIEYWTEVTEHIAECGDLSGLLNEQSRYHVSLSSYDYVKEQRDKTLVISDEWTVTKKICSEHGITMHSVLQFAWHKVLHVYGGGHQTVVGTIVSGRNMPIDDIEISAGLFINTLPLVVDHDIHKTQTVLEAIADIQAGVNRMNNRSNVELGQLQQGHLKHGLFDSLFVLENYPNLDKRVTQQCNQYLQVRNTRQVEKLDYPLAIVCRETDAGAISFTIYYAGELFNDETIDELLDLVNWLFVQIAQNIDARVVDFEFITERQQLQLDRWNATNADFTAKTLSQIFEYEARIMPTKIAVVYKDVKLTYGELNERSNKLARYLRSLVDIKPDQLIAIFVDKSEHMIISILAVLKAGAAYVPIDPSYPRDRIQFILEDTKAELILANKRYNDKLQGFDCTAVDIESSADFAASFDGSNLPQLSRYSDLAYVIYTSGTTGKPKGVMVEHIGVANLHTSLQHIFSLKEKDDEVILSFSNYVFDHFVEQMTDALLNGQTLVVLDDEMRTDKEKLYKYMNDNNVTYLSGTPSVLSEYEFDGLTSLRRVDAVGEDFSELSFNKIRKTFSGLIINGYGPTEISITSHKRLYPLGEMRLDKSIGNQVANTTSYVLNKEMKRVPVGAIGELYIGGIGVARGYLNRPELTAEKFVANPFDGEEFIGGQKNTRMYKTGDIARWLPNGEIECLGRTDFQVKLRGLRIELGEIESVMLSFPGIVQSVVVAKELKSDSQTRKYLVGYYVSAAGKMLSGHDIVNYMQSKLPQYMVPNRVARIDKIPVNINGKLDTKQLPELDFIGSKTGDYVAPRNELEIKLCTVWSELLCIPVDQIGVHDDFFSLGGDSLMCIKLLFMITSAMSSSVDVATVFNHRTIESLAAYIMKQTDADGGLDGNELKERASSAATAAVDASLSQERLLFIHEFERGTNAYNIPINVRLSTDVQKKVLKRALFSVVMRHGALRTLLKFNDNGTRQQQVLDEQQTRCIFQIAEIAAGNATELDETLIALSKHIFCLDTELPIRLAFVDNVQNNDYFCMSIVVHHICFDGWSWNVFQRDLKAFYEFHLNDDIGMNLPSLKVQYAEFSTWQRRQLSGKRLSTLLDFWKKKLDHFEPLNLPIDFSRPPNFDYCGKDIPFEMEVETCDSLKALAKQLKVSLFSVLVSAFSLMLCNYAGQHDIVIGTPVANRNRPELDDIIGFFVNMIALRINVDHNATVTDYISSVSDEIIQSQIHQELPFDRLVKLLRVENDPSRQPIAQVVFSLDQNEAASRHVTNYGQYSLEMSKYVPSTDGSTVAKYDIFVTVSESDTGFRGNVNFATSLFHESTIRGFVGNYKHILKQFAELTSSSDCRIKNLSAVDEASSRQILSEMIALSPQRFANGSKTLQQVFEEQVAAAEEKVAIVYKDVKLTYRELNEKANRLAHYIRSLIDIQPDKLIALFMNKSEHMIVSILAVWKTGAAYVPIDPSYPSVRIQYILEDTKASAVLTDEVHSSILEKIAPHVLVLAVDSSVAATVVNQFPAFNLSSHTTAASLAYVIFTSGSTGKPKGVLIEHSGVVNLRDDLAIRYFGTGDQQQQTVLFMSNYVFDFSVEQLILSILCGNTLLIPCNQISFDNQFYDYVNEHKMTFMSGTPTLLQQVNLSILEHLQTLLLAGEVFHCGHYQKIRKEFGGKVMVAYGVTETTVYNTVTCFPDADSQFRSTLGDVLSNMKAYVLNENLQLLPTGAVGELYLSGNCVARGYLGQSELTKRSFLDNPFRTALDKQLGQFARIYKTGDLVRYRPSGELEYIGRKDTQVKIRGLRIELGEIESVLATYPGVTQCTVLTKSDDNNSKQAKYIVGYYVSDNASLEHGNMMTFLGNKLPDYMVPAKLIRVQDKLPMTITGKLDTKALPAANFMTEKAHYVSPRTDVETRLCAIWSSLLGIENIGIDDDFFQLGGDSIMSLQLVSQIRCELNFDITVKDVYLLKTMRNLLADRNTKPEHQISTATEHRSEQGMLNGDVPLLPIQRWFFAKNIANESHWNQCVAFVTPLLDMDRLKVALRSLTDHHDAFHLRFRKNGDERIQFYDPQPIELRIHTVDVSTMRNGNNQLTDLLGQWQRGFSIENGPTCSVGYLHGYDDGSARLWFAMHHLVVDTVSWRILLRDIQTLYSGGTLGQKGSSYRQWVHAIQNYSCSDFEAAYWTNLTDDIRLHGQRMPATGCRPIDVNFSLSANQTNVLLRDCHRAYDTKTDDLLLVAMSYALAAITQTKRNYVTLERHGREDGIDHSLNLSNTVGWFTSMFPFAVEALDDLGSTISGIKVAMQRVPSNGIGYGAKFGYVAEQMPRVSFNYLGQLDRRSSGFWRFADDVGNSAMSLSANSHREPTNNDAIDVTCFCLNGQMNMNIQSYLGQAITDQFTTAFEMKLKETVSYTLNASNHRSVSERAADDFVPYFEFQEQSANGNQILFIFPPGEGGAESYFNNIVRHLSQQNCRLVAFNNYYLHYKTPATFEQLAAYYINHIRKIQPHGPFHFLGWSFGGVLATELSIQLISSGDKIANLFLIDSYFNVQKACADIGHPYEKELIDRINFVYFPKEADLRKLASGVQHVVLFKACKLNDTYRSAKQKKLYEYYMKTKYNNLETLLDRNVIELIELPDDTHVSWVKNERQLCTLCSTLLTYMLS